jgi:hypothetical protein
MTPGDVARIVERRDEYAFVDLLRAADPEFEDAAFEPALADAGGGWDTDVVDGLTLPAFAHRFAPPPSTAWARSVRAVPPPGTGSVSSPPG